MAGEEDMPLGKIPAHLLLLFLLFSRPYCCEVSGFPQFLWCSGSKGDGVAMAVKSTHNQS